MNPWFYEYVNGNISFTVRRIHTAAQNEDIEERMIGDFGVGTGILVHLWFKNYQLIEIIDPLMLYYSPWLQA